MRQTQATSLCMKRSVCTQSHRALSVSLLINDAVVAPEEAPTGMMARGHYSAVSKFIDDDNHTHLEFEWSFDITKDWK